MNDYTVYKHTTPSGKIYIGITLQKDLNRRWQNGSGYRTQRRFYRAIKKYGWENIKHEIVMTSLSKQEAENAEIALIREFQTTDPKYGYNIENGGNCSGTHSEETKKKISDKLKGNKHTLGMKHTEDAKKRMGETKKKNGFKPWIMGRGHSEETKERLREVNAFRKKKVLCISTGIVYESIKEASEKTGANKKSIGYCCNGKYKHSGGYEWQFYLEGE